MVDVFSLFFLSSFFFLLFCLFVIWVFLLGVFFVFRFLLLLFVNDEKTMQFHFFNWARSPEKYKIFF